MRSRKGYMVSSGIGALKRGGIRGLGYCKNVLFEGVGALTLSVQMVTDLFHTVGEVKAINT